MGKIKILYISNVAGRRGGGISEVVQSLLYYQKLLTYNSELWFMGNRRTIEKISEDYKIDKDRLKSIKRFIGIKNSISPSFFFNIDKVSKKYEIIHQHGVFLPISIFTLFQKRNVKKVISPHGFLEPEKMKVSKYKKRIAMFLFEKANLKKCDCLIACSNQEAIHLKDLGLVNPIAILPNGVKDSFVKKNISNSNDFNFKANNNINLSTKILLFLSRIHPFKGLILLLNSIIKIKEHFRENDWILVIAGPDELNHTNELIKLVGDNNINDIVKFVGPQYGDNKRIAIDAAECLILPSKGENFGIVVIEALARGVPVITTKSTPWDELEINNCGWWIDRNEDKISSTIIDLINMDKKRLINMGINGIKLVRKKYVWSEIAKISINIYKWIINNFNEKYFKGFIAFNLKDK